MAIEGSGNQPNPLTKRPVIQPQHRPHPLAQPETPTRASAKRDGVTLSAGAARTTAPLQSSSTTKPLVHRERRSLLTDATPLTPASGMAIRREFSHIPLQPKNALQAYRHLTGHDFAGPDDLRLQQINRVVARENIGMQRTIASELKAAGIDAMVGGRAKTPSSFYGKLFEPPKPGEPMPTVGDIKDASGLRIDINATKPNGEQFYQARDVVKKAFGDAFHAKHDYIRDPNPASKGGYAGRIHDGISGENVPNHELQIGPRDLGKGLIEKKVTNASGQAREIHDLTGYKGTVYGAKVSPELQNEYQGLMKAVSDNAMHGKTLAQNPELQARVDAFTLSVQKGLPETFKQPAPPELATATKLRNLAGKGMGVLGIAGGAIQAFGGVQELRHGHKVDGAADVSGGAANVVAGGAMLAGRAALGATAGGVVAVIDGGKDMIDGVRSGNREETVVGGVKTAAGAAMIAGVATANPVLIAGGAITYGAALVYENRAAIKNAALSSEAWVGNEAKHAAHALSNVGHAIAGWF